MATIHDVLSSHLKEWMRVRGNKKKRGEITRIICAAIKIHPKSVPRAMKRLQVNGAALQRGGRPTIYTLNVVTALKDIWDLGDQCCGELLHPIIPAYIRSLRQEGRWLHDPEATKKLLSMSERTVKRLTRSLQQRHGTRRGTTTTAPSLFKLTIPIFKGPWKDLPPGKGQVDTVAHCGDSMAGDFIFTVNYTDVALYWVIPRAQWNKGFQTTKESLEAIRACLPWELRGIHPDSGGEFINRNLKAWCDETKIEFTRSEPGKKNDNMYVEERNGHVVRKYTGYTRYDVPEIVPVLNELYETLGLYLNHWKAVRRIVSKDKVGSKYVRTYEQKAKTPYERALSHPLVLEAVKERLREQHERSSPYALLRRIDMLRLKIHKLQSAARTERSHS